MEAENWITTGNAPIQTSVVVEDGAAMLVIKGVVDELFECKSVRVKPRPPIAVNRSDRITLADREFFCCRLLMRMGYRIAIVIAQSCVDRPPLGQRHIVVQGQIDDLVAVWTLTPRHSKV